MHLVVKPPMMPPIMPAMNSDDVKSCSPWLLYLLQSMENARHVRNHGLSIRQLNEELCAMAAGPMHITSMHCCRWMRW